ncbi:MAG: hypothetical protein GAK31_01224 [Stenotrophomonas maltophilia]|uniref:Uncharacterized protein n=1 Tax=Stenotrophomonas maltophilia TaxID=40324 RepID=A0A7V8JLW0_STEMA|nr:MAG: hypothetical protein GAK31_01224 [Stenotrophomonas maltophilia]
MNPWLSLPVIVVALAGCSTEARYQALGSPDPQGAPVRYPLDFPICQANALTGGEIIVPLKLRISTAGLPDPMRVMAERRKGPAMKGCPKGPPGLTTPAVQQKDSFLRTQTLDHTGQGYFAASTYSWELLSPGTLSEEAAKRRDVERLRAENLQRFGKSQEKVEQSRTQETINGRRWEHRLLELYETTLADAGSRQLREWNEIYEHALPGGYLPRRSARYSTMIVQDPVWLAPRRAMLRDLVQSVTIAPVDDAQIAAFIAEDARQRKALNEAFFRGKL